MRNFVPIATFSFAHEFAVLRLLLEKEGLRFYFQNENIIGIIPFHLNNGVILKVHPEDAEQAENILKELNDRTTLKKV